MEYEFQPHKLEQSKCHGLCSGIDKSFWDFLMPVYCICLQESQDRFNKTEKRLCEVGLCEMAIFYRPERYKLKENETEYKPGVLGCFKSHRDLTALNPKGVTVFEDDVVFDKDIVKKLPDIRKSLENVKNVDPDFDCYFLGHLPIIGMNKINKNTVKTYYSLYTHALYYSPKACSQISKLNTNSLRGLVKIPTNMLFWYNSKSKNQYDEFTAQLNNYSFFPMVIFQDQTNQSTIGNPVFMNSFLVKSMEKVNLSFICILIIVLLLFKLLV